MNILVARNDDWGIGKDGSQSIIIPDDRRRFRELTDGAAIVLGHSTLLDFPGGRPLAGRRNIILSRTRGLQIDGAAVVHSLRDLFTLLKSCDTDSVYVIGGASVFTLLLPYCKHALVTHIRATPPSDTFFPNLDEDPHWALDRKGEPRTYSGVTYSFDSYRNQALLTQMIGM